MPKYVLVFLVTGAILLPAGCSKEEAVRPAAVTVEAVVEEPKAPAAAGFAYPLRVGMWLYTIDNDTGAQADLIKAAEPIPLGERLQLVSAEPRKATNPYDSRVYDFYRVRRDTGREGVIFATQLSLGSSLAVVADEKANIYRSPRNADATDYILSRKIVLGVLPETERDGFIQIEAYDPVNQTYRRGLFVKTAALSYRDADVQSSILLQTAEALDPEKEKNRRDALLDSALYDYPNSIFADDIRALIMGVPVTGVSAVPAREIDRFFAVIDDNVSVHEGPDLSSPVVRQLAKGTALRAVEETVDEYTVGGQRARWYRVTQFVEGWIFGAWLESVQ
jgi:hypothetical protein